jgi:DNA gyrase/topoisomerase IV subunit B
MAENKQDLFAYTEESIRSLDWKEHIRLRPGMYIGKLGDGNRLKCRLKRRQLVYVTMAGVYPWAKWWML